jgi:Prokaryotic Cytochrome C oxidase subunit IV
MDNNQNLENRKYEMYRIGLTVMILLVVLTIGEYALGAVGANWTSVFIAIALFKACGVIRDYMHIGKLFSSEEEYHE